MKRGQKKVPLCNGKRPRAYAAWVNMRQRCTNSRHADAKNYVGRGIAYSPAWETFEAFFFDMGEPSDGKTLERINNDGDYSKENCRWATRAEQNLNKRNIKRYFFNGKSLTLGQWQKETGIGRLTLYHRIKSGMSIEQALNWKLWAKK